jgi:hypothetical protein
LAEEEHLRVFRSIRGEIREHLESNLLPRTMGAIEILFPRLLRRGVFSKTRGGEGYAEAL